MKSRGVAHRRGGVSLMGLSIDALTEREVGAAILEALEAGEGGWVITPNLEHLRLYVSSPELRDLYRQADLVVADGMPLVWASRLMGTPLPERVPGSGLIWSVTEGAARRGRSVFLLGGGSGGAERAAERLRQSFSTLQVAGALSPSVGFQAGPEEIKAIDEALATARPDIVYVGLGHPKTEHLIRVLRQRFPQTWFLGVGISIAFVAGDVRRAPAWMRRSGLEWLHRLAQEPRRLAPRYLVHGPGITVRLLLHSMSARLRGPR